MSVDPHAGSAPARPTAEPRVGGQWRADPPNAGTDAPGVAARAGASFDGTGPGAGHRSRRRRRWPFVAVVVALVLALAAGVYLLVLAQAWSERAAELEGVAEGLGTELAQARSDLAEASNALATTQDQLTAAQQRITELADRVAQTGDDRELQRQVAAYQARISAAATAVALAMDDCIRGQEQLIGYLDDADAYDPAQLADFRTRVGEFCTAATEANDELQRQIDG